MRELNPDFVDLEISNTYFISSGFEDGYRERIAFYEQSGASFDQEREAWERGWAEGGFEEALRTWFEVATQIEGICAVYVACD